MQSNCPETLATGSRQRLSDPALQSVTSTELPLDHGTQAAPRVAFDGRPLNPRTRHWGVGVVVDNVVSRLSASFKFVGVSYGFQGASEQGIRTWPSVPRLNTFLFEGSSVLAGDVDLYWGTNHFVPATVRMPSVVTIHDLLLMLYPHEQPLSRFAAHRMVSAARHARKVVADSKTTASDLLTRCPELKRKIEVIYLGYRNVGCDRFATPLLREGDEYVVMLGAHRPRKNLSLAINTVAILREKGLMCRLVVTGDVHNSFMREIERNRDIVQTRGVVAVDQLTSLLRNAIALLFPSRYEGFGLPMLEAMAAGCPVIALDTPINREISGRGALLLSDRPSEWSVAVQRLADSESFRNEMQARGFENLSRFSWEETAASYSEVFRQVAR